MQIHGVTGLDWDEGNESKCQKHGVSLSEIETAFHGEMKIFPDLAHSQNETRPCGNAKGKLISAPSARATSTERRLNIMKKQLPVLNTDKEAEDFIGHADLTEYDLSSLTPVRFEFQPKERSITMRLSEPLLEAIKEEAGRSGIPYQRFIRQTLENAVHPKR
jgi:predicted DNA binding CopG/RHH family protein